MTPRLDRVDEHDVQVAGQSAVLEAVVQHQDLALQLLESTRG